MNPRRGFAANLVARSFASFAGLALVASGTPLALAQGVPPPPQLSSLPPSAAVMPAAAQKAAAPARAASAASATASAAAANARVLEDDGVRIEEARGPRGQLQRVTVQSKVGGAKVYEVIVPPGGKDPSQQPRGATGQSAWSLFDW